MSLKASLADQLKKLSPTFDFNDYGKLPGKELICNAAATIPEMAAQDDLVNQWSKLQYLADHLEALDKYIQENSNETLIDWTQRLNLVMAPHLIAEIGKFDNKTGGISVYFLKLQQIFDEQEEIYDGMESDPYIMNEYANELNPLRANRDKKRKQRRDARKMQYKELKKDSKGYFVINLPIVDTASAKETTETIVTADGRIETPENAINAAIEENMVLAADGMQAEDENMRKIKSAGANVGKIVVILGGIAIGIAAINVFTRTAS